LNHGVYNVLLYCKLFAAQTFKFIDFNMETNKIWKSPFDFIELVSHKDERGFLFEIMRFKDYNIPGTGQLYTFSIQPHKRRGDHYHLKKQEWFTCVNGKAVVLLTSSDGIDKIIEISAENPKIIYAAPGTSHALINQTDEVAIIVSYASTQHNPEDEDTYRKMAYPEFQFTTI
jgi:dTDP-4-dehydrorhamnose 3,5-epimerase-like enzyme